MILVLERVASAEDWAKEDPLARVSSAPRLPPIYIDCTREDPFGFFEGAQGFAERLKQGGQSVVFHEETGPHCEIDADEAGAFLAKLSAE